MSFHDLGLDERLLIARRGTAYFAGRLGELADDELDQPSMLPGWSRRHLIAHVGYNAAALCRLLDWAATGVETPMYGSPQQRTAEIDEGATLSAASLRNLFVHTVARLNGKWRNLPESAWRAQVRTAQGRIISAEETAWMRTREVWIHAVDLDNGARFGDFPVVVLQSLLDDIVGMWRRKGSGAGLILSVDSGDRVAVQEDSPPAGTVAGPLPAVVRWAAGRGHIDLRAGHHLIAPDWL